MTPTFLIEIGVYDDGNPEQMADVLTKMGYPQVFCWSYIRYNPENDSIQFVKPSTKYHKLAKHYIENDNFSLNTGPVIFYGSLRCAKQIKNRLWEPAVSVSGVWLDLDKFRCQNYFVYYGEYLLSKHYVMMPLKEVMRNKDELFLKYGDNLVFSKLPIDHVATNAIFIRPDDGDKPFDGEVVQYKDIDRWYNDPPAKFPIRLVVIATPVPIEQEWRLVVTSLIRGQGKVIAGSQYRKIVDGELSVEWEKGYPLEVAQFAEEIISKTAWTPHPIFCMDIAKSNGELKLVEIGSVNTSGLYCCDIKKVVEAMIDIAKCG